MTIDDKIRHKKVQCDINKEPAKILLYHQVKLINLKILPVKKYYLLIKGK